MYDFTDGQIAMALVYCRCDYGELCEICPYVCITGGECSKKLKADAAKRIEKLVKERDELKSKID